jgi:hypothetical protein
MGDGGGVAFLVENAADAVEQNIVFADLVQEFPAPGAVFEVAMNARGVIAAAAEEVPGQLFMGRAAGLCRLCTCHGS